MLLWLLLFLLIVPGDTPEIPAGRLGARGSPRDHPRVPRLHARYQYKKVRPLDKRPPREASAPSTGTQLVHESKLLWGTLAVRWELLGRLGVTLCVPGVPLGLLG